MSRIYKLLQPHTIRMNANFFFGRMKNDELLLPYKQRDILYNYRKESIDCQSERNTLEFIKICRKTINLLATIDHNNPLYIHPQAIDNNINIFNKIINKAFSKSCVVKYPPHAVLNNNSGYAICNTHIKQIDVSQDSINITPQIGISKLTSIICPLLLPNIISVFVDYKYLSQNKLIVDPLDILLAAFEHAGINLLDDNDNNDNNDTASNIDVLLGDANAHQYSIMFCADGITSIYENNKIWGQFHAVINSLYNSIFLSDINPNFDILIKCEDKVILKKLFAYKKFQPSLNSSKIFILHMDSD